MKHTHFQQKYQQGPATSTIKIRRQCANNINRTNTRPYKNEWSLSLFNIRESTDYTEQDPAKEGLKKL